MPGFPTTTLNRTYRQLRSFPRLRQIVNVLLKHGFGQLVEQLNLQGIISVGRRLAFLKDAGRVPAAPPPG